MHKKGTCERIFTDQRAAGPLTSMKGWLIQLLGAERHLRVSLRRKSEFPQCTHNINRARIRSTNLFAFITIMKTKSGKFVATISMIGLVASLSAPATAADNSADTPEIRAAVQNATTRSDHEAIAKYYEDAASQMQAKVKEQKELLEQYQNKSYLYGRRAQDLQSHTEALIRDYKRNIATDMQEAALHRQMASKLDDNHATSGTQSPAL